MSTVIGHILQWSTNTEVQVYQSILPITQRLVKGIFGGHSDERKQNMDECCVRVGQKFTAKNCRFWSPLIELQNY